MPNSHKKKNSKDESESSKKTQLRGQAYIGLGKDAKRDVFYNFSSNGAIEYDVLPSENGQIPQLKITQKGHPPIYTMDYYYTNIPSKLLMIIRGTENKDTSSQQGAAAPQFLFAEDPLQAGEIYISADEVHRQNIPYLDLCEQNITSLADLQAAFQNLVLCRCQEETEQKTDGRKDPK